MATTSMSALLDVRELGKKLTEAGRLKLRPLCVYGTDKIPEGAVPSYKVDRCIAKAVYTAALFEETPLLYIEAAHEQCCGGGLVWTGLGEPNPKLKYFVTVGTPYDLSRMTLRPVGPMVTATASVSFSTPRSIRFRASS